MSKASKNTIIYGFGMIVLAAAGLLNTGVLTRVLDSRVYAMYGLLITAANAVVTVLSLGYQNSYMRFYYDHSRVQLRFFLRCIAVPVLLLGCFIVILSEPRQALVTMLFDQKLSKAGIVLLALYLLFLMIHQFSARGVRMQERAWNYVLSECVFKFGFIIIVAVLFLKGEKLSFEQIAAALAACTIAAVLINLGCVRPAKKQTDPIKNGVMSQAHLLRFGFPLMINTATVLTIPLIEKVLIRQLSGWETLGIYTAASVFFTLVNLFSAAVNNVWEPIVYQKHQDRQKFQPIFHDVTFGATVISILAFAFSVLLRRWVVLLLAPQYCAVLAIVPTIIYAACFQTTAGFYAIGINVSQKTIHYVITPLIRIVSSVTLCVWLIPQYGLSGIAVSALISILLSHGYRSVIGLRCYSTGTRETKSLLLWSLCLPICFVTLVQQSIWIDLALFVAVLALLITIGNRELFSLFQKGWRFFFLEK